MRLEPLQSPPADPALARRLLATTAFEPPDRAVLDPVEPWTLYEARVAIHALRGDALRFSLTPPHLRDLESLVLRTSSARWERPMVLPPALLDATHARLAEWEARTGRPHGGAHLLVRAEHGYRMVFRASEQVVTVDLAVTPPRVVRSSSRIVPSRPSWVDVVRSAGRRSLDRLGGE